MSKSKVVIYGVIGKNLMVLDEEDRADLCPNSMNCLVSQADYKALEDDREALVDLVNELQKRLRSRNEELASLKARVRELVDKGYESASAIAIASAGMQKILEGIK